MKSYTHPVQYLICYYYNSIDSIPYAVFSISMTYFINGGLFLLIPFTILSTPPPPSPLAVISFVYFESVSVFCLLWDLDSTYK